MKFDQHAEHVFDRVANSEQHLLVSARAGTGKTTVLVEASRRISPYKTILSAAFGRDVKRELGERLDERVRVRTLNSIGFELCRQHIRGLGPLSKDVTYRRIRSVIAAQRRNDEVEQVTAIARAVSRAKNGLVTSEEQVHAVCLASDVIDPADIEVVLKVLERAKTDLSEIDFDDQISLPARLGLPVTVRSDVVLLDEFQDVSAAQFWLAQHCARERLIVFGDPFQGIYAFRGAGGETLDLMLSELEPETATLAMSYRCPHEVCAYVLSTCPEVAPFYAATDNEQGRVMTDLDTDELTGPYGPKPGDFVIARTNFGVFDAWCALLGCGYPVVIAGRDVTPWMLRKINEVERGDGAWMSPEDFEDPDDDFKAATLGILRKAVLRLFRFYGSWSAVRDAVRGMATDNAGSRAHIVIGTVHKLKGLERDRVWVMGSTFPALNDRESQALWYVACTRARRELYIIGKPGNESGTWKRRARK